jgi:hypothetical protein
LEQRQLAGARLLQRSEGIFRRSICDVRIPRLLLADLCFPGGARPPA